MAGGREYFLFCLRFLIELLCVKPFEQTARENCAKVISYGALQLSAEGMPEVLNVLVEVCNKVSQCFFCCACCITWYPESPH